MSLRSRPERLERSLLSQVEEPWAIALLDDGERIAIGEDGQGLPWPPEEPLPQRCKVYGFDPRAA
jgi:hypothetical protein